jgi:hypothetical protein
MGEAAGTAAALSLKTDVPPRQLDIATLQDELHNQNCILNEQDIEEVQKKDEASHQGIQRTR